MHHQTPGSNTYPTSNKIVALRLTIAALQGVALWRLVEAAEHERLYERDGAIFIALWATALFVPTLAVAAIGNIRGQTLLAWLVVATGLCFGLGLHAGHQFVPATYSFGWWWQNLVFDTVLGGLLFVGHALVSAGDADRRWIARFPTYFDLSWRHATLLGLAGLFVGVFWGVLVLGGMLFHAIGVRRFSNILTENWFWLPATTITVAASIHLIDSRTKMVRGARTLVLGMLAWLMPLLVAIGLAFLIALPFTGLQPLWDTRRATSVLLTAAIVLILLINSHFQTGGPESRKPALLVVARAIAAVMLTPLTILAAYGLELRVNQYGWSPSRVVSAAVIVGVACHALGYLYAIVRSRTALAQLPRTNVASAIVIVLMMLCLLSPVADPARLSVADQLNRLMSGKISPQQFDYAFLARHSGRYGIDALEALKTATGSPLTDQIAERAKTGSHPEPAWRPQPKPPAEVIVVVYPADQTLPSAFLQKGWIERDAAACLKTGTSRCEAVLLDLDGDGRLEVVLIDDEYLGRVTVYREISGTWMYWGVMNDARCPGVLSALRTGHFELVPAITKDVIANGHRLRVTPGCTGLSP
jgi:hypothetical protein